MELWYTEQHTDDVRFSIKVNKHLYSAQSEFQRIDIFEAVEFGKFLTLDGLMMVTEK
ncbi:MAG TPA: spermidine synthase, partial [Peptococcaceae bacterium]|nr:spermidine synthase [Peptococcaceae bacterium]